MKRALAEGLFALKWVYCSLRILDGRPSGSSRSKVSRAPWCVRIRRASGKSCNRNPTCHPHNAPRGRYYPP